MQVQIVKLKMRNGNFVWGSVLQETSSELTIASGKAIAVYQRCDILQISKLATKHMNRRSHTRKRRSPSSAPREESEKPLPPKRPAQSSLYLLSLGHNCYKVGYTKNIAKRLRTFKTTSLDKIEVLGTHQTSREKVTEMEAQLKKTFAQRFQRSGEGTEVFRVTNPSRALLTFRKSLAQM